MDGVEKVGCAYLARFDFNNQLDLDSGDYMEKADVGAASGLVGHSRRRNIANL